MLKNRQGGIMYEFEQCEAATAKGTRCKRGATTYVRNLGAIMPFQVCETHRVQGQKLADTLEGIPTTWGKFNFSRAIF
jgi:hypothetical protein